MITNILRELRQLIAATALAAISSLSHAALWTETSLLDMPEIAGQPGVSVTHSLDASGHTITYTIANASYTNLSNQDANFGFYWMWNWVGYAGLTHYDNATKTFYKPAANGVDHEFAMQIGCPMAGCSGSVSEGTILAGSIAAEPGQPLWATASTSTWPSQLPGYEAITGDASWAVPFFHLGMLAPNETGKYSYEVKAWFADENLASGIANGTTTTGWDVWNSGWTVWQPQASQVPTPPALPLALTALAAAALLTRRQRATQKR
jgi:hypothetical protein